MATTSNFGWETPDDTDLVKDGAAAMRTLGNSIDTSFVDLKGGTTGQILSKNSNTDMDFVWIANDQGDITGVTAGTGITGGGTSGTVTVSFDQANYGGGQYAAGKNKILNANMAINQRSFTSTTASGTYGFDRWQLSTNGGTCTYTAEAFTPGAAPVTGYEAKNFARLVTTGQSAAGDYSDLQQYNESVLTYAGQTVTVSFWAKAATGTPKVSVELAQNFGTGGSPSAAVNTNAGVVTLSTSWTRYSVSVAIPSISGKTIGTTTDGYLGLRLWVSAGTNYSARTNSIGIQSGTFDFWGVQVEAGSTATPFQTASGGSPQAELAMCQRYYQRVYAGANYGRISLLGMSETATSAQLGLPNFATMRISPSSVDFPTASTLRLSDVATGTTVTGITLSAQSNRSNAMVVVTVAAGLIPFRPYYLEGNNDANAYIGFNAEL